MAHLPALAPLHPARVAFRPGVACVTTHPVSQHTLQVASHTCCLMAARTPCSSFLKSGSSLGEACIGHFVAAAFAVAVAAAFISAAAFVAAAGADSRLDSLMAAHCRSPGRVPPVQHCAATSAALAAHCSTVAPLTATQVACAAARGGSQQGAAMGEAGAAGQQPGHHHEGVFSFLPRRVVLQRSHTSISSMFFFSALLLARVPACLWCRIVSTCVALLD